MFKKQQGQLTVIVPVYIRVIFENNAILPAWHRHS